MARRRKGNDLPDLAAQLFGLVFLLAWVSPPFRQKLSEIGAFCLVLAVVASIALVLFIAFRLWHRRIQVAHEYQNSPVQSRPGMPNAPSLASERQREKPSLALPPNTSFSLPPSGVRTPKPLDLAQQIQSIDWFQFEKIVATAYKSRGFSVCRRGGANPDGGIDLILEKSGQRTGVQCKQWKSWQVGVRNVREFFGALTHAGLSKGIFVTIRGYTREARDLAQQHHIELLDATALVALLEAANARFDPEIIALLNDKRKFCPKCEAEMILRTARKGAFAGRDFWSCSTFPVCRYKMESV